MPTPWLRPRCNPRRAACGAHGTRHALAAADASPAGAVGGVGGAPSEPRRGRGHGSRHVVHGGVRALRRGVDRMRCLAPFSHVRVRASGAGGALGAGASDGPVDPSCGGVVRRGRCCEGRCCRGCPRWLSGERRRRRAAGRAPPAVTCRAAGCSVPVPRPLGVPPGQCGCRQQHRRQCACAAAGHG